MDRSLSPKELLSVWVAYVEIRKPVVNPNTWLYDYQKIERRILLLLKEHPDMNNSRDMRQWLIDRFSLETARRTLQQWNAAFKWAVSADEFTHNPFNGMTRHLTTRRQQRIEDYTAFTKKERLIILKTFEINAPYYFDWVWFLFNSGCRPEEASALRWEHISLERGEILIKEARRSDTGLVGPTKNYQSTRFRCNDSMQNFLYRRSDDCTSEYVLPAKKGGPFDYKNFQSRHWKPTIKRLVQLGKVSFELSQYHCRHTFITEMIRAGMSVEDVGYLCRVSTAIIQRYYVSQSRIISVPEI